MRFDFGVNPDGKNWKETKIAANCMKGAIMTIVSMAVGNSFLVTGNAGNFRITVERGRGGRIPQKVTVYYENLVEQRFDLRCTIEVVRIDDSEGLVINDWIGETASDNLTVSMLRDIVNPNADWIQLETTPA